LLGKAGTSKEVPRFSASSTKRIGFTYSGAGGIVSEVNYWIFRGIYLSGEWREKY